MSAKKASLHPLSREMLPEDWELLPVGNVLVDSQYGTSAAAVTGGHTAVVGMKDIENGRVLTNDLGRTNLNDKERSKYLLKKYDLLINRTNSYDLVGKAGVYDSDLEAVFASYLVRLNVAENKVNTRYLNYWLNSYIAQKTIKRISTRAIGQANLNPTEFKKHCHIALPSLDEQTVIANLLSTWDEAIEKSELLIQAKQSQLNQIANELIYEQAVLGRWAEVNARTLFKERKEANRGDLPLLSITNTQGVIPRDETNRKDTSNVDKSKYLRICPGDLGYNTMRMWQGVSALSALEGIVSPAYTICVPGKKLDPQYVAFLFKMPFMIHRFYRYSQGLTSDTWNLKFRHFGEVNIPLPSLDEQKRISETLSTAHLEIEILKQLTEKYRAQKRGLIQKLLIGEWRVSTDPMETATCA